MKHLLGLLLLLALCGMLAATDLRLLVGLDAAGETVMKNDGFILGNANIIVPTVSAQFENKNKNLIYGFGVDYQFPRKNVKLPGDGQSNLGNHSYIPVYGLLSYNFLSTDKISTEVIGQLGYSFPFFEFPNNDDNERYSVKGGLFTGLGFGINNNNLTLNVLYRVNTIRIKNEEFVHNAWEEYFASDYHTRQFNVSLGYRFGPKKQK
ncbi:hypothetical protein MASR2M64_02200 [Candidatus Cloacimonadota bacterium]